MDKKNFTKLTVIAYCQRCNKSSHADIEEISKYNESIASMIEKHTELKWSNEELKKFRNFVKIARDIFQPIVTTL